MLGVSGAEGLASAIRKYLKTDMIFKKLTAAKKHMDIMAGSIVEAMGAGTPLQTAGAKARGRPVVYSLVSMTRT
jgi:hypothetical protein